MHTMNCDFLIKFLMYLQYGDLRVGTSKRVQCRLLLSLGTVNTDNTGYNCQENEQEDLFPLYFHLESESDSLKSIKRITNFPFFSCQIFCSCSAQPLSAGSSEVCWCLVCGCLEKAVIM